MPASDGYATEIAGLEAALAVGELTIESDGERVTYKNTDQMLRSLDYFRRQSSAGSVSGARPNTTVAVYSVD